MIPYCVPFIEDEELQEVMHSFHSNWLSKGPKTVEFEKQFSDYVQANHSIALNSCTAGLHLAILAAGIGPGDEVITTPYTFVATANTILHTGAKPVFVDIDPVTMNINPHLLVEKITPKTKAIIPVHFAGYPCEMDLIMDIARTYNLVVIEDAAHSVYTTYKGRMIGSIGDMTCFSFYATKNLATGEGGMLTTNKEEWADQIRVMSLHGMSKNAWNRYTAKNSWFYEVEYPGYKYNMTDIQASLGLVQLKKLPMMQAIREKYAFLYHEAFSKNEGFILPHHDEIHRHAWHLYVIRLKEDAFNIDRAAFIEELTQRGIGTSVHFIPVHMHPYYQKLEYRIGDYPEAEKAYAHAISLPLYPKMSESDVYRVIEAVQDVAHQYKR
jgi:dTDP-4-amino-4,6-dideoxygalactose transaminase